MTTETTPVVTTIVSGVATANVIETYVVDSIEFWCPGCRCRHAQTIKRNPRRTLKLERVSSLPFICDCGAEFVVRY